MGHLVRGREVGGVERGGNATLSRGQVRPPGPPSEQAETWFERASEWDNDPAHWQDAIEAYRRVVAIDSRYAAAWDKLRLLLHRVGGHDQAGGAPPAPPQAPPPLRRAQANPRKPPP